MDGRWLRAWRSEDEAKVGIGLRITGIGLRIRFGFGSCVLMGRLGLVVIIVGFVQYLLVDHM